MDKISKLSNHRCFQMQSINFIILSYLTIADFFYIMPFCDDVMIQYFQSIHDGYTVDYEIKDSIALYLNGVIVAIIKIIYEQNELKYEFNYDYHFWSELIPNDCSLEAFKLFVGENCGKCVTNHYELHNKCITPLKFRSDSHFILSQIFIKMKCTKILLYCLNEDSYHYHFSYIVKGLIIQNEIDILQMEIVIEKLLNYNACKKEFVIVAMCNGRVQILQLLMNLFNFTARYISDLFDDINENDFAINSNSFEVVGGWLNEQNYDWSDD